MKFHNESLCYDFVHEKDTFLVISGNDPITEKDLIPHQIPMIRYNQIPRLLTMDMEEFDLAVRFNYKISGKRMLSQVLRGTKLTLNQYYRLLAEILSALEECAEYLLNPENFILHEDFIFLDSQLSRVWLTYVPLAGFQADSRIQGNIRQLAGGMMSAVEQLHGSGIQTLMGTMKDEKFSINDLKRDIRKLLEEENRSGCESPVIMPVEAVRPESAPLQEVHASADYRGAFRTIPLYVLFAAGLGLIWGVYAFHPEESLIYIAFGGSGLWLNLLYLFSKKYKIPLSIHIRRSVPAEASVVKVMPKSPVVVMPKIDGNISKHAIPAANPTTLLAIPDATVLLGSQRPSGLFCGKLEIRKGDRTENMELTGECLTIGRNEQAGYVDDTPGVSRVHCEIIRNGVQYFVKDLGSVNGSYLNGKKLVPYKEYPLKSGDVLRIVRTEYKFNLT
ncbi:DUF6382 domain-containing protein [Ferviditalea candida]|uniref:DUF6382 domain-containing protein n=1 Tax=Ferviditalea candida TaxID=3108399 RepID=A0ABU5ZJJ3_9BACL|nr:DUF6382 domain-containing protein [Paenibacillaceae bacterium T2]